MLTHCHKSNLSFYFVFFINIFHRTYFSINYPFLHFVFCILYFRQYTSVGELGPNVLTKHISCCFQEI